MNMGKVPGLTHGNFVSWFTITASTKKGSTIPSRLHMEKVGSNTFAARDRPLAAGTLTTSGDAWRAG
jgi:hypothetical protein